MTRAEEKQKSSHIGLIIRIIVAIAAIFLIFKMGDWKWHEITSAFKQLSLWAFLAAIGLFMLASLTIGIRWFFLLKSQHIEIDAWTCIRLTFLGVFYNNILVSSVGGDLIKIWYVVKHTDKRVEAGFSVVVDRVLGLATLLCMAFGSYWLFPVENDEELELVWKLGIFQTATNYWQWILSGIALLIIAAAIILICEKTRTLIFSLINKVFSRIHRVWNAIKLYLRNPFTICGGIGLTIIAQCCSIIGFLLIGRSMGIEADIKYYFVFFPLSWVMGALPISPGGAGVLEGSVVYLFTRIPGVAEEQALVLALCQRMVFLAGAVPGIFVHLTGGHLPRTEELEKEIFIDSGVDLD